MKQLVSQTIQSRYPAFYLSLANLSVSLTVLGNQSARFRLEFKKHDTFRWRPRKELDFSRAGQIVNWFGDQIEHLQKLADYYTENIEKQCAGLTKNE